MRKKKKILIGNNLHQLRKLKKITLVELSKNCGVQIATLSRIENNQMTGTVESHISIAEALGVNLEALYKDALISTLPKSDKTPPPELIEPHIHNDKAYSEILVKDAYLKKMLPMVIKIDSGGKTSIEKGAFGAEKLIYVLSGGIKLVIGENTIHLKKDTAYYFEAVSDHYMMNANKNPAKVLCVSSPVKI